MKTAHLVWRGENPFHHGTSELWDCGGGAGIYVDCNPCIPYIPNPETMAFPYDMKHRKVSSLAELGTWLHDATGGEAMRDLVYEPVE